MRVLYCCYRPLYNHGLTYASQGSFPYLMPEMARHSDGLHLLAPVVRGRAAGNVPFTLSETLHVVPIRGFHSRWLHLLSAELWSIRALRQFIRVQRNVDVVVMAIPSSTYYAVFLPFLRKPMVAVVAGDEQALLTCSPHPVIRIARTIGLHQVKRLCQREFLRRASAIVCRSLNLARSCEQVLGARRRVPMHIITSGIDTDLFKPCAREEKAQARRKVGLDEAVPVVGCVATALSGAKGADVLREAFGRMRSEMPAAMLLLVGEERGAFSAEEGVVRYGWVSHAHLAWFYAAMDVFVCPSLNEGAPKVVMEACACGLPVVASRVGAIPEWFENGQDGHSGLSGLAVDVGDSEGVSDACLRLLPDPDLRARVGANARALAVSRFDYRTCAAQLADVLRTAVSNDGRLRH